MVLSNTPLILKKMTKEFDNFFIFGSTFSKNPVCVSNQKLNFEEASQLVVGNHPNLNFPLKFKQTSGKKWTDILAPLSVGLYIVSKRFINILEENLISGWKTYSIKVFDKEQQENNEYVGLSITGKCGPIDYAKSERLFKQLVENGPKTKYVKGLYFDINSWDQTDFFIPKNTLSIIITKKVKDLLEQKQNLEYTFNERRGLRNSRIWASAQ